MKIQCPKCQAKYRAQSPVAVSAPVVVTCPKCHHRFSVEPVIETGPRPKVLIVDDARFFRELIIDLLKGHHFDFETATCGEEALNIVQNQQIDLLIVDVNLPDIGGFELIRRIRSDERCAVIPILCISGVHRHDDDARSAYMAGADDFMTKSFHPDDFILRIEKLLKR